MFKIRFTAPKASSFVAVSGADVADAVGHFIENKLSQCLFVRAKNGSGSAAETGYYALVEVEGHGELVGRYFYSGIGRAGGVSRPHPNERQSLAEVERDLGLSEGFLSNNDAWEGEESADEAWKRKFNDGGKRSDN